LASADGKQDSVLEGFSPFYPVSLIKIKKPPRVFGRAAMKRMEKLLLDSKKQEICFLQGKRKRNQISLKEMP